MHVKALKPHGNAFGNAFWKKKGAVYSLPDVDAKPLIAAKLIVETKSAPKAPDEAANGADG